LFLPALRQDFVRISLSNLRFIFLHIFSKQQCVLIFGKGKGIPETDLGGTYGSKVDLGGTYGSKVVILMGWLPFTQGQSVAGSISSIEKSVYLIENRTHVFLACSLVP
jgi:hypothetical protein